MLGLGIAAAGLSLSSILSPEVAGLVIVVIPGALQVLLALMGVNEDLGQICRTDSITI